MNRQKRKIRMVGMDLDGTLFNNEKIITDHTKKILTKAIEQGVTVLRDWASSVGAAVRTAESSGNPICPDG